MIVFRQRRCCNLFLASPLFLREKEPSWVRGMTWMLYWPLVGFPTKLWIRRPKISRERKRKKKANKPGILLFCELYSSAIIGYSDSSSSCSSNTDHQLLKHWKRNKKKKGGETVLPSPALTRMFEKIQTFLCLLPMGKMQLFYVRPT